MLVVCPLDKLQELLSLTLSQIAGIPLQIMTDCGSETTQLHAMAKALWWVASNQHQQEAVQCSYLLFNSSESFHLDIDPMETPAHVYMRSVHNIAVERSWLRLCLEFGDNAVIVFKRGEDDGIYLAHIPEHVYVFFSGRHCLSHELL
jgi:hypothetical protein